MTIPVVPFQRTPCPFCGGTRHSAGTKKLVGSVIVRYHKCECGKAFKTHEDVVVKKKKRRKAKVRRET